MQLYYNSLFCYITRVMLRLGQEKSYVYPMMPICLPSVILIGLQETSLYSSICFTFTLIYLGIQFGSSQTYFNSFKTIFLAQNVRYCIQTWVL